VKFLQVETFSSLQAGTADPEPGTGLRSEKDLAVMIYTSGTTGRPKGVMLSHGNLLANVDSCRIVLEAVPDDCLAVLLPMFHTYMMTVGLFLPFTVGGSIVLVKSLHPPRAMLQEIFSRRATILPGVPSLYRMLLSADLPPSQPIRIFISGSAPLPMQTIKAFEEKFKVPLIEGYGLSEAGPVVSKNPLHGVRKAGSIGLPIPNVEMSVQDDQGKILPPGETGEICVRGGNVMQGYWNQPKESKKAFRDGWLLTGDIAERDDEGNYRIRGRAKELVVSGGENIYPAEIEAVLHEHPAVADAAVVGAPDERWGEVCVAFVVLSSPVSDDELRAHCLEHLARFKVPKAFHVVDDLPRNSMGKILKGELVRT
jgi:long-chain acyl-CoA synthetase